MEQRTLQHPLKTQRRLGIAVLVGHQQGGILIDKYFEFGAQQLNIATTGLDHRGGGVVLGQHQQQVFHRDKFMTLLIGVMEGFVERLFQFFI